MKDQRGKIPIIILNWNGIADTIKCVDHIRAQTIYDDLQIFLADNHSNEKDVCALKDLKQQFPEIELRLFDENYGFAKAHNILFDEIFTGSEASEFILLINNDAFADKHWAEELICVANESKWGMVSSKMINFFHSDRLDNIGHRMLNTAEIIPKGHGEPVQNYQESHINMGACGGAALYRTEMLADIGFFDPYFITGYEDAELGLRANVSGYLSGFAPKAIVYHKISQSIRKVRNFDYVKKTQLNIFYSYFKLLPWLVIVINLPFLIFKYLIVLVLNLIFGRWFFFRVMSSAIFQLFHSEWIYIKKSRRQFYKNRKVVSSIFLISRMEFFLWVDVKRFVKHMVFRKPTYFENTNDD